MPFILARALTCAALFTGLVLIVLPARILSASGITRPAALGVWQVSGLLLGACGGGIALLCVLTFACVGRGTPAPFDPPRRLVSSGPYRVVRNPMYLGAGLALAGAALYYQSIALIGFAGVFLMAAHLFIRLYEEPTLRRKFGDDYEAYCRRAGRWWPGRGGRRVQEYRK